MTIEMTDSVDGTYVYGSFSEATITMLQDFVERFEIPNATAPEKLHTTMLYSSKHLPDFKARGIIVPAYYGIPLAIEKWQGTPKADGKTYWYLILVFSCPELVLRARELVEVHKGVHSFPQYVAHTTLSYDVGEDYDTTALDARLLGQIEIVKESSEDLVLNWKTKGEE